MNIFKSITNKVTQVTGKVGLKIAQSKPEIFFVIGIVGVAAATIELCKKSLNTNDILKEHNDKLDEIEDAMQSEESVDINPVKEKRAVYIYTGKKMIKNYGPGILLMSASIACLCKSHNLLRSTITELASAYAILDDKFQGYRSRVIEAVGEEKEHDIYYDTHDVVEQTVDENGNVKSTVKTVRNGLSAEARYFDSDNPNWQENPAASLMFLRGVEKQANTYFDLRGYVFLNEVYEWLGYPITSYGQVICWVKGKGDNRIDFGLNEKFNARFRDGAEDVAILDFNHNGAIYKEIAKLKLYNNGAGTRRDIYNLGSNSKYAYCR